MKVLDSDEMRPLKPQLIPPILDLVFVLLLAVGSDMFPVAFVIPILSITPCCAMPQTDVLA